MRDGRYEVYKRKDGWGDATKVHPNPDGPGWICPKCGAVATVFFGRGPEFDGKRWRGPDRRVCKACYS
jgi:hypothetical protein